MKFIDNFLNSITMYRLVLFVTGIYSILAIGLNVFGILHFSTLWLIISLIILCSSAIIFNYILGKIFRIPTNAESSLITAFILFLILAPASNTQEIFGIILASLLAMSAKYVLGYMGKHFFNPAAVSAVLVGLTGIATATWWVASPYMLPAVLVGGFLIVRKIRRFSLFFAFLTTALLSIVVNGIFSGGQFLNLLRDAFVSWPVIFFGTVMLTEPLTTPPHQNLQIFYGGITGLLFGSSFKLGILYNTPELSLVLANIFSYIASPKQKLVLRLEKIVQMAPLVYDFIFSTEKPLSFIPGQYLEWTLETKTWDDRGNRRYFTIASSPTEKNIHLGVKIPTQSSSFKNALLNLKPGQEMLAGQLSGDFILPEDPNIPVVTIAGGIGITPFRSMAKYMTDKKIKRDTILFYASSDPAEFVYGDIFEHAKPFGLKTINILSGSKTIPEDWKGKVGFIDKQLIEAEVPNYKQRLYFLSGPNVMVNAYKKLLLSMGISRRNIVTDYFPGY